MTSSCRSSASDDYIAARQKFLEEARVLAQFHHPGIVQVHTFFEENNTAYMVMEFLRGKTLQSLVGTQGNLAEDAAVQYIEKVAEALKVVHQANIVHRDVKPENIMLCEDGRVVLIDFGLTKQEIGGSHGTRPLTGTSAIGTDGYAPIEQYSRHTHFGPPTDIYAFGATLYYLFTAQVPTPATERAAGLEMVSPQQLNPKISAAVSAAIVSALAMQAKQRPQSIQEFLDALHSRSAITSGTSPAPPLQATRTRAGANIERWRKALGTAQAAANRAQYTMVLPSHLTDDADVALQQLQTADWLTAIKIEKAALAAGDEVLSVAKRGLDQELKRCAAATRAAQQVQHSATAACEKREREAEHKRSAEQQALQASEPGKVLLPLTDGLLLAVAALIGGYVLGFVVAVIGFMIFGFMGYHTTPKWFDQCLNVIALGPAATVVAATIYYAIVGSGAAARAAERSQAIDATCTRDIAAARQQMEAAMPALREALVLCRQHEQRVREALEMLSG